VNFENFRHTTKYTIYRIVKLLGNLSTRLKSQSTKLIQNVAL